MEGTIVRFVADKGFGFIAVSNGTEFFFHKSKIISSQMPEEGMAVTFDALATEKGMAAENIRLRGRAFKLYEESIGGVVTFKAEKPGKGTEAVLTSDSEITVEDRDPNEAIRRLKEKARRAGYNCLLSLRRDRRTGVAWSNMNYKYSIHRMTARPALVFNIRYTHDDSAAAAALARVQEKIQSIGSAPLQDEEVADASAFQPIIALIALIVFIIIATTVLSKFNERKNSFNSSNPPWRTGKLDAIESTMIASRSSNRVELFVLGENQTLSLKSPNG